MTSHTRNCKFIAFELRNQINNELAQKNENSASVDHVRPSDIPALRYSPVIPQEYYRRSPSSQLLSPLADITTTSLSGSNTDSPAPKRPHYSASLGENELLYSPPHEQIQRQQEFNQDIVRLLCSCELSFYLLERPQFRHFVTKWIPNVQLPDRRTASESLLDKECDRIVSRTKERVEGKLASYQCDGWKNVAKTSVVSSMILVDNEVFGFAIRFLK